MFPSAGYFKGLLCPFFQSGLCERPYCHFKHAKPEEGKPQLQRSTSTSSSYLESLSDKPWSVSTSTNGESSATSQSNNEQSSSTPEPKKVIGYNKYTGDPIYDEFKQEKYEVESPNVKSVILNKYTGEPEYPNNSTRSLKSSAIPEYRPTPIEELKKKNGNESKNEYDPEQNFSTKPVTASHSLPLHVAAKRLVTYEPTSIRPAKVPRKSSYEFDISKFSDSEDSTQEKEEPDEEYSPIPVTENQGQSKNSSKTKESSKLINSVSIFDKLSKLKDKVKPPKEFSLFEKLTKELKESEKLKDSPKDEKLSQETKVEVDSSLPGDSIKKDVKYFENLLLDDPTKSSLEDVIKGKTHDDKSEENSKNGVKEIEEIPKKKRKYTKSFELSESENEEEDKARNVSQNNEKNKDNSISKDSIKKKDEKTTKFSDRSHSKDKSSSSRSHKHSSSSHHSSKTHSNKDKTKEKSSGNKSSSDKKTKSSDSKIESKSVRLKADSKTKEQSKRSGPEGKHSDKPSSSGSEVKHSDKPSSSGQQDKNSHKNSSNHKNSSSSNHKHSSSSKQSDHKSSSKNSSSSSNHSHKSKHSSSSSSSSKHSSDKERKSSSDKRHQKSRSSNSTDSDKKSSSGKSDKVKKRGSTEHKILDINVDLFGDDSDKDLLDDSDIESHPLINSDDLSDVDTYDECLQIFQESKQSKPKSVSKKHSPEKKKTEGPVVIPGKKRVAHASNSTEAKRKIPEKPYSKLSPAQVMHNRFLEMRKKALEEAAKLHSSSSKESSSSTPSSSKSKVAHQPKPNGSKKPEKTVITTASKTQKRQARTPNVSNLARPQIPAEFGSKVPTNIRQRYLNLIIDECLKLCDDEEEAFKKGQEEEMAVYRRSNTKTIYLNVAINAIKRLRNEVAEMSPSTSKQSKMNAMKLSHEAVLGGKNATKATYTVNRSGNTSKVFDNFKGADLYKNLVPYILTEDQLKENGFPRPDPDNPGSALIQNEKIYKKNDRFHEKICVRCGKKFVVYPTGKYAKQEECIYHWAKAWKRKVNGSFDSRYNCCQGDSSSEGCQIAKYHVHDTNKWENLSGFMKTLPCSPPIDGDFGVFAMDCEMIYTTAGVELARVTVSDQDNTAVYETFVKPDSDVVDLNTRFSGITEDDLEDVTTSLRDVQAVLLSLFTDKTILIGHSLESDLTAVKLIHNTVVDTSLVFPHRLGLPYKRALRTLMAEYLQKIIQDDVGGHDSMEDAVSCMELMHMKLKEDAKKKR